jgi:hypothetical protein
MFLSFAESGTSGVRMIAFYAAEPAVDGYWSDRQEQYSLDPARRSLLSAIDGSAHDDL